MSLAVLSRFCVCTKSGYQMNFNIAVGVALKTPSASCVHVSYILYAPLWPYM